MSAVSGGRIRDVADRRLRWTQRRTFAQDYELRADDKPIATLVFGNPFGSRATGESGDGCWTFKRLGFISTRVTIRPCGTEQDLAVFRNNTWSGGGTLELPGGLSYRANSNFWQTRYAIETEAGLPLITLSRVGGLLHLSSDVEIHPAALTGAELPWLVMLGWYLTVMQHRDSAVAVS